jgi:CSLREA domain-containing protein
MLRTTLLAALLSLVAAGTAGAATFTVTTTRDATDAAIDGTCAAAGGGCTLRAAIQEANATTAADEVVLPAGRYRITLAGTFEDAGAQGDFDSTHDLTITGAGAGLTVVDGNGADRVLEGLGGALIVQRVTITGGLGAVDGRGIQSSSGTLVVRDSAIVGNGGTADFSGGGIYAGGTSTLIERSLVARNRAYNGGGIDGGGTITIRSSTIAYNTAGSPANNGDGGALDSIATIVDSAIIGNIAFNGAGSPGGIYRGTLRNTVLAGNVSFDTSNPTTPAVADNCSAPIVSQGNNVSDDDTCALAGPGDRNDLDPMLSELAGHGGPFDSFVPLPGSPLIDTGAGCDPLDIRGLSRPRGAACDVGPAETSAPALAGAAATAIGQTAALVTGAVDSGLAPTTVHVEYGTTAAYGASSPEGAGDGPLAVTLSGLAPGTAYHARLVATNGYGSTAGPDVTFTTVAAPAGPIARDLTAPRMSKLRLPKKVRGKLRLTLSERAKVTIVFVNGKGRRRATLRLSATKGANSVRLPRKLKPGRYAVVLYARDTSGNTTAAQIKAIRLRKR